MDVQILRLDDRKLGLVVADNLEFMLHLWVREDAGVLMLCDGRYSWTLLSPCWLQCSQGHEV